MSDQPPAVTPEDAESDIDEFLRGYLQLDFAELERLVALADLPPLEKRVTNAGTVLYLLTDSRPYVIEVDDEGVAEAEAVSDLIDRLSNFGGVDNYIRLPDFNQEFWDFPAPLYHGTSETSWAKIRKTGLEPRSDSRGISNRFVGSAVFTSLDVNVPADYGDVIVQIDTTAMKRDGYTPQVSLEEGIEEAEALRALAHSLGVEYEPEIEYGIDPETVVIFGPVAAKYLRLLEPGPTENPRRGPVRLSRGQVTWVKPPKAAVSTAKKALERQAKLAASKRGGLTKSEAGKLGITSGIARAESIARGEEQPAEDIRDFFNRFKGTYQDAILKGKRWEDSKVQQAWDIWGGSPMWKAALKALEKAPKKRGSGRMPAGFLRLNPCPPCLLLAGLNPAAKPRDIQVDQGACAGVKMIEAFCER